MDGFELHIETRNKALEFINNNEYDPIREEIDNLFLNHFSDIDGDEEDIED